MRPPDLKGHLVLLVIIAGLLMIVGCSTDEADKIPITTSSRKALRAYIKGQSLSDRHRQLEGVEYFEKAVETDPEFALAYLQLAYAQQNTRGLLEYYEEAKALIDKVSDGERLWILAVEAGINGDQTGQQELLKQLVAAYPRDERAYFMLGAFFFNLQEWDKSIEQLERSIKIAPDFSPAYNILGYCHRNLGDYDAAERAFKKYIELIPNDPNPYDSYAELLLKMGKFDASIESYEKALSINSRFYASHIGIATNLNLKDQHEQARKRLHEVYVKALNDGQRRKIHAARAVSYVDEGYPELAIEEFKKQHKLAEKSHDIAEMAHSLNIIGIIFLEMQKPEEAKQKFDAALKLWEDSDYSETIKGQIRRGNLSNSALVAIVEGNLEDARNFAVAYSRQADSSGSPSEIWFAHQLAGMIALKEQNYDGAIEELQQSNQRAPYNFYRMAQAYEAKGDLGTARELYLKAANFNQLNSLNYAFIRKTAQQKAAEL